MSFGAFPNDPGLPFDAPSVLMPPPSGDPTGATDAANITAALAQIANGRGILRFRAGTYKDNTQRARQDYVTYQGEGGLGGGAAPGTILTYNGTAASYLNWAGGIGVGVRDMMVFANQAGFTGRLIDLSSTTLARIRDCYLGSVDTTAAVLVELDTGVDSIIEGCNIVGGKYGIESVATAGHISNAHTILSNRIGGQGAAGAGIHGLQGGWNVIGNIFELQPGQIGIAAGLTASVGGLVAGNWFGDATIPNVSMQVSGNGLAIVGNYIANGATGKLIQFAGTSDGISIKGNRFDTATLGIDKNAQVVTNLELGPNSYVGVTTHHNFVAAGAVYIEA